MEYQITIEEIPSTIPGDTPLATITHTIIVTMPLGDKLEITRVSRDNEHIRVTFFRTIAYLGE